MNKEQVDNILSQKNFFEVCNNDYGTIYVNDIYRIGIIFTDVYSESNIEHYEELRNNAKVSEQIIDPSYLDKSTLMTFNTTTDDLNETLCDTFDFIKSNVSIINFLPESRKEVYLHEMENINDRGDIWINPYTRFHANGFLNNLFKGVFKANKPITIKYPQILHDSMDLSWMRYWVKKISI